MGARAGRAAEDAPGFGEPAVVVQGDKAGGEEVPVDAHAVAGGFRG